MRLAYAILAHRNPSQLARLVSALSGPETIFAIHIDRATQQAPFETALADAAAVYFVQRRVKAYLYSYRLIDATLRCFDLALARGADVIALLSGQDYPLCSAAEIHTFFENHSDRQFIDHRQISPDFWEERIDHYYFNSMRPILAQRAMNRVAKLLPRRTTELPIYGGSAWLSVSASFARHLIETLGKPTAISRFMRFAHVPEELAIQTVAMNSEFAATVINDNLRYIRWKPAATHPDVFSDGDFDELIASGKLIARKFDLENHPRLLDRLDEHARRSKS